jgi:phosphate transport system protein
VAEHLRREIDNLKYKLLAMSGVAEASVANAVRALVERSEDLAKAVIQSDIEVDQMEVEIEEDCLKILALHQPVAIDLRFIIAVLKINSDLERVGDLAVNIAERAVYLATHEQIDIPFDFAGMAVKVQKMLTGSIDSLVNLDTRQAYRIRAQDEEIDSMNREMYQLVKNSLVEKPEHANTLIHTLSVGRHLERIADHATNIAEDVIYLVDAEIIRHRPETYEDEV